MTGPSGQTNSLPHSLTAFSRQVREVLSHLDDPGYLERHPLARLAQPDTSSRRSSRGRALREALIEAIGALEPPGSGATQAHQSRTHLILSLRYVEGLAVSRVLDRLALSRTALYVELQRAVDAVASVLWDRWSLEEAGDEPGRAPIAVRRGPRLMASRRSDVADAAPQPLAPTTNLPLQLTSFVGRVREISEVRRLLGNTRLLTLTGTGGCGKTRLAYEVAAEVLAESLEGFSDGVWVVELASVSDPDLVPQTVASALGLREAPSESMLETLLRYLKPKRLLLILDNCEHLLDASARIAEHLLRACPQLTILATSRELLGIGGEVVWRVPSLSTPDPRDPRSVDRLSEHESVTLFLERARLVQSGFEITERNATALAEVCARLDGIPLAIELAAARTSGLTVEQIRDRLGDRFGLLTGGRRTALRRQQTLRATIDWSYDLLTEPERVLLRRLSVFSGGWTLEAAESVCPGGKGGEESIRRDTVLDLLLHLVDRSLVVAEEMMGEVRYRLPETIRQYAQEKLVDAGEVGALHDRHRDWYRVLARQAEPELVGVNAAVWLNRLEAEHNNLRAALARCLEGDVERGLEMVGCLLWFWDNHCNYREGRRWAEELLARSTAETLARARALRTATSMARGATDGAAAQRFAEESLRLARRLGDRREIGRAAEALADILRFTREHSGEAESLLLEGLALARESGDLLTVGEALYDLGGHVQMQGNGRRGIQLIEESLAVVREIGFRHGIATRLRDLAELSLLEGDSARARAYLDECLPLFREEGHGFGISSGLATLGFLVLDAGNLAHARALLRESLTIAREIGSRMAALLTLCLACDIAAVGRSFEEAVRLHGALDAEMNRLGYRALPVHSWVQGRSLTTARSTLSEEAFARAWAEGQAMTLEQAVEYALSEGG